MPIMKPADVQAFFDQTGWTESEMSRQTGYTRNTLAKYRAEGAPLQFALVAAALTAGLEPWRPADGSRSEVAAFRTRIEYAQALMNKARAGDPSVKFSGRRYRMTGFRIDPDGEIVTVEVEPDG